MQVTCAITALHGGPRRTELLQSDVWEERSDIATNSRSRDGSHRLRAVRSRTRLDFLIHIRAIIILLVLGILFAAAIEPLTFRLRRRGFSRAQAILVVYAGLIVLLGLVLYLIVPPLVNQATALVDDIPSILTDLRDQAAASENEFIRTTGTRTLDRAMDAYNDFRNSPNIESSQAIRYATTAVGALFTMMSRRWSSHSIG